MPQTQLQTACEGEGVLPVQCFSPLRRLLTEVGSGQAVVLPSLPAARAFKAGLLFTF